MASTAEGGGSNHASDDAATRTCTAWAAAADTDSSDYTDHGQRHRHRQHDQARGAATRHMMPTSLDRLLRRHIYHLHLPS